jgi:lysophospholipase L1-like esterase
VKLFFRLFILLLAGWAIQRTQAADIVCLGDSITKGGYPEILARLLGVEVVNAGTGGNTSANGLKRIDKALAQHKPRVLVILFGTNDARVDAPAVYVDVKTYVSNLTQMIESGTHSGAQVVLCTPPPIDETGFFKRHDQAKFDAVGGVEKLYASYRAAVVRLGKDHQVPVVDLGARLKDDLSWLSDDGVHPTPKGYEAIAQLVAEQVALLLKPHSPATTPLRTPEAH